MPEYQEISLRKGEEFYRIRWAPGREEMAFEELSRLVNNPEVNFDGIDAAIMARIINERAKMRENANE